MCSFNFFIFCKATDNELCDIVASLHILTHYTIPLHDSDFKATNEITMLELYIRVCKGNCIYVGIGT